MTAEIDYDILALGKGVIVGCDAHRPGRRLRRPAGDHLQQPVRARG